ncbi:MAG TPA: PRC-barrel domain-containing protein [Symbiobacteriaceae bacterium]|jgi:uncharacterized protein YrrD
MVKAGDLIGLPVLGGPQLKRLGQVQEVLFSPDGRQVCGLLLDGGWFQPARILDYRAVQTVGETHVLAAEVYLTQENGAKSRQDLHGLPVLRGNGEEAGLMDDLVFDAATGAVTGLQLSRGLVDDLYHGKTVIPLEADVIAGEAAILLGGPGDVSGGTFS